MAESNSFISIVTLFSDDWESAKKFEVRYSKNADSENLLQRNEPKIYIERMIHLQKLQVLLEGISRLSTRFYQESLNQTTLKWHLLSLLAVKLSKLVDLKI